MKDAQVAIVGGGPAGLMAAEVVATAGVRAVIYDRMPSFARKFLLAGRGGLNLTHSEPLERFLSRYGEATPYLREAIEAFPPQALRDWSENLGQPTFVGSSGRIFPDAFKASPLLRAWLSRLDRLGVGFARRHHWLGWDPGGTLRFQTPDGARLVTADATVLALGGASWPRLGSDGAWRDVLVSRGVAASVLKPANCGFRVAWSEMFRDRFEGHPLKNVALGFGAQSVRGEAVITREGIEGGGIYALGAPLRGEIERAGHAVLRIGLRPDLPLPELAGRLAAPRRKQSVATFLRKAAGLSPVGIGLLQEAAIASGAPLATLPPADLAELINAVPVELTGTAPLERAISTAGGIAFDEVDARFMLRKWPGVFLAGEMLDWEAPTGGYLLQAAFATGAMAGRGVLEFLRR